MMCGADDKTAMDEGMGTRVFEQRFSTFLMPWTFNTVPHVVVTPNHVIISLSLHNCNFAIVMNRNVNI